MHTILGFVALFLLAPVIAVKKIIIETDLLSFPDDVAALTLANFFHKRRRAEILGIVSNVRSKNSPLAIEAINEYYFNDNITLAQTMPTNDSTSEAFHGQPFVEELISTFPPHDIPKLRTPVEFYRNVLSANNDVTILSLGFFNNLADLYRSEGGRDLISRQVKELVVQGGHFESLKNDTSVGYNLNIDLDSALILQNWPSPVTYIGGGLPDQVTINDTLTTVPPSPVQLALERFKTPTSTVSSGDPLTVYYGVLGLGTDFKYGGKPGRLLINRDDVNDFRSTAIIIPDDTPADRLQQYLALAPGADSTELANRINDILRLPPIPN